MVNATSALVLILILSFAADRVARGVLMGLSLLPTWRARFPDPAGLEDKAAKAEATRRRTIAYTVIVGGLAGLILWLYQDIRLIGLLTGQRDIAVVDIVVSAVVIMGGSDLISRIAGLSGINEAMPLRGPQSAPVEISGRIELENTERGPQAS